MQTPAADLLIANAGEAAVPFVDLAQYRVASPQEKSPSLSAGAAMPYRCHHAKAPAQGGKAGNDDLAAIIHRSI
jgi:hypothetical protein